MSNPTATTMRARLAKAGRPVADDATPKDLVTAYGAWVKEGKPVTEPKPEPKATRTAKPASKPAKAPANCGCGCGQPTITTRATFLPGHDARYAGMVARGEVEANDAVITPALEAKIAKIKANVDAKARVAQAKAAAKAAYEAALADALA